MYKLFTAGASVCAAVGIYQLKRLKSQSGGDCTSYTFLQSVVVPVAEPDEPGCSGEADGAAAVL